MKKHSQHSNTRKNKPATVQTGLECNYSNNYYGDQICKLTPVKQRK